MPVHNVEVARAFEEIADLLELQGANPFRVRAYRNAAQTVGNRALDLAAAVRRCGGARRIAGDTEESVYAALGLRFVPPEQREEGGDLAAAPQRRRPPGGTSSTGTGL